MARIRRSDTRPEKVVRTLLHKLGYRYRLQFAEVPGRPDIAFTKKRKAIFIHGCFWHAHEVCRQGRLPQTRTDFWAAKFARNKERDKRLLKNARSQGWQTLIIWECELKDKSKVERRLRGFLGSSS